MSNEPPNSPVFRSNRVKAIAADLGFDRCGVTTASPIGRADFLREWLSRGYAGTMGYLHRHVESRIDVRSWLPWARSIIVVALNYRQAPREKPIDEPRGRVAMYAWGEDYHDVIREKLDRMAGRIQAEFFIDAPDTADLAIAPRVQSCVDTSAILERELAAVSGVGWIGKNTLVMHESLGSYFFLGELITDLELAPDSPAVDHCGTCTRCLEACPTQAFVAPYVMDASRCISYLTIEHRSEIDPTLSTRTGDWVFGCDVCQDVCPHNRHAPESHELRFRPPSQEASVDAAFPRLSDIDSWDRAAYERAVAGRATGRARLDMWKRNASLIHKQRDPSG
ncbi:MAG: tRNA epoxyqueuosine(34) reductase QueG [Phycisphaerae bacterium]|nr:tRNA epoxyqueuosine(34) reductase QueG [Phycisphaerae bacterium]